MILQDWSVVNLSEVFSEEKLLEIILGFKDDISGLRVDIKEHSTNMKKYNGLWDRFDKIEIVTADKIEKIETTIAEVKDSQTKCQTECKTKDKVEDKIEDKQDKKKNIFRLDLANIIQIAIGAVAIAALLKN